MPVRLLNARSATQTRGPGGAKRCVWHPRWLINRAASKLAPRQLRSYFLGNPWNIYTRYGEDLPSIRPFKCSIRPDRFEERLWNSYRWWFTQSHPPKLPTPYGTIYSTRLTPFARYYQPSWLIYGDEDVVKETKLDLKYDTLINNISLIIILKCWYDCTIYT